jgi:repressor LexA
MGSSTNSVYAFSMSKNRLQELRQAKGWSQGELAQAVGTTGQQIGRLEAGTRKLTVEWMRLLAPALGVNIIDLMASGAQNTVPLVGFVGAAAEIFSIDDHEKGAGREEVDRPQGASSSTVAVRVRGDSMRPTYKDGDMLYYDFQANGDLDHLIGHDCVVKLADGRALVKELRKNSAGYWLHSHNADPMIGVSIEWAAKVKWVRKG